MVVRRRPKSVGADLACSPALSVTYSTAAATVAASCGAKLTYNMAEAIYPVAHSQVKLPSVVFRHVAPFRHSAAADGCAVHGSNISHRLP